MAKYQHDGRAKRVNHHRRTYDESILDDLMEWSAEGQFLDEIVAQWGISRETLDQWQAEHPELAELMPVARAKARAAIYRQMRSALSTKTAFPAALADRLSTLLANEAAGNSIEAAGLVMVGGCSCQAQGRTAEQPRSRPHAAPGIALLAPR